MREKIRQASAHLNNLFFLFSFLLFAGAAFSQTVTGTVADADRKPIGNATVQVKGTSRPVVTDDAGKFSINAADNDVLVISYVGHITQEVPLNGRQVVSVAMVLDNSNMGNVVITALGIRRESKKLDYAAETVKVKVVVKHV